MVTRRYIKDYKFSESVTARGGIRTEAVYVGKYYRFEDADGAAKSARLLLPGSLAAWLLFIAALLPKSGASRLMWVILPFAFSSATGRPPPCPSGGGGGRCGSSAPRRTR